ncbi:hypothetical protein [Arthrobacter sp. zg-Y1110]|uniref:hypothetical protein n=1 Tax=Arthrobacter sp. zg-Y1110 TaxID=2886932 RepID=UPI001D149827|nr:hypothetical protein [Arthrobacter sp. zg-Y1110]MCC3289818.1 hypothetical protein [Arthrobacter sp. zg-Y1110]UWX84765.1 hypothetical protein N2K99_15125 [Arthrobacter sp. zg-Y1110]
MTEARKVQPHPAGKCWWCGKPGDSGEHKVKKTDLRRIFTNKKESESIFLSPTAVETNSKLRIMQGPDSKLIKFPNILCKVCNNAQSQPFDRAYTDFIAYYARHRERIMDERSIDFRKIYGRSTWRREVLHLSKYLLKHAGCRIAEQGFKVNESVAAFLNSPAAELPGIHLGMHLDTSLQNLVASETAGEFELRVFLPDLDVHFAESISDTAFGVFKEQRLYYISGKMFIDSLVFEWQVFYEELKSPLRFPFRKPVYNLILTDSVKH